MSIPPPTSANALVSEAGKGAAEVVSDAVAGAASSEFEAVRMAGFRGMRFPPAMEAAYQAHRAPARLTELRWTALLFIVLNLGIFTADWLMVPDQFSLALTLRLLILVPLAVASIALFRRLGLAAREWLAMLLGTAMAGVNAALSWASTDELAPAYLVALTLVQLFNSGLINLRWRMLMRASAIVLLLFGGTVWALRDPPLVIMAAIALVLASTALYTSVGAYRLEREDRANWLMQQHEQLLLAELHRENNRLAQLSKFDPLTGLANRRYADEFLARVWARCSHAGEDVALLMLDVDHFKSYNDIYGHQQGDACLWTVADTLKGLVRNPEDLLARFGGEEFIAVLPRSSLSVALAAAQRLRDGVAQLTLPHAGATVHSKVTLSVGVASVRADAPGATPERLLAAADEALYKAKSSGRNGVAAFEAGPLPKADRGQGAASPVPPPAPGVGMGMEDPALRKAREVERAEVVVATAIFDQSDWVLRFPAALERQFVNQVSSRMQYFSVSGLLSLLVFNGFLFVDYLMIPDVFWLAVQVRLGLFTPFALAIQGLLHYGRDWVQRHWSAGMVEGVILMRSVLTAVCMAYLLSASSNPLSQYYHVGLVVIVVYVNAIQRLRFWYAVTFSLIMLAISIGCAAMLPAFNPRLTVPITMLLAVTAVFTLMPVYAMERDERRHFLLTRRRAHLMEDLAEVQLRLQTLSSTDALTGLSNRRHLQERLHQLWQRALHDGADVSILMLDVDHFKAYNDRYGHQAGDRCLTLVAQALTDCARGPSDIVARFGGEEFIIVLPGTDGVSAQRVAGRVRQAVEALRITHEGSMASKVVTVSIGVASCMARPDLSESALIAKADAALYEAKQGGRNRVHMT